MKRRFLAGVLAFILLFSNLQVSAYAEALDGTVSVTESGIDVLENAVEQEDKAGEDITVSGNTTEDESTVSGNETGEEPFDDTGDESVVDEPAEEELATEVPVIEAMLPEKSVTETFLVDVEAPYDGDFLLVANTNTDMSGEDESTGRLPAASVASASVKGVGNADSAGEEENIRGYDKWGRGLIDPNAHLPELEWDGVKTATVNDELKNRSTEAVPYRVNDTRTFYLENGAEGYYNPVTCVCLAVGTDSTVWVPIDDPIYIAKPDLMKNYMSSLAAEFDSQHDKMLTMFGDDTTADYLGDNDGKTALVCYDINGDFEDSPWSYVGGYYFGADLDFPFSNATDNNCDMLHIDSWQGMGRDTDSNILADALASRGTIVHEFQHMINFSVSRNNESYGIYSYSIVPPTYLNEAFSMAAEHLCYGADECYSRVKYYNNYAHITKGYVSLMEWGKYDTLSNYALSYLFGQYIRTQYSGGDTIYRDAMNQYDSSQEDFLDIIADLLGVDSNELLLNFRAALFLKSAEGKYGFKGEAWAENIAQKATTSYSLAATDLAPGAAVVVPMNSTYTPTADAGDNIDFIGLYSDMTDDDITVSISGGNSITEPGGQLQLTASVSPKGAPQAVVFSIPEEKHMAYAMVTQDGLVTAIADGEVAVRATSVYNPEKYDELTITVSGQRKVAIEKNEEILDEGYRVSFVVTDPVDANMYYTYEYVAPYDNGNLKDVDPDSVPDPTAQSDPLPGQPFEFTKAGTHVLKVIGIAEGYADNLMTAVYEIEEVPAPYIDVEWNDDGTGLVTITAQEETEVAYTTDGTDPVRNGNGMVYERPFIIAEPGWTTVKAIAYKPGCATSFVQEMWNIEIPVATPQISVENDWGGKRISMESAASEAKIYYTLDGSEPNAGSNLYTGSVWLEDTGTVTVKTVAIVDDNTDTLYEFDEEGNVSAIEETFDANSSVASETVTIGKTAPVKNLDGKKILVPDEERIFLASSTAGARIYYTENGTQPTPASDIFPTNGKEMPDNKVQIRAYARSMGNEDSEIAEFEIFPYRELTKLELVKDSEFLYVNAPGKNAVGLEVEIAPANVYEEQLVWTSSDKSVVTVDKYGNVTAVAGGTAIITVSSGGLKDTCTVTVGNAIEKITVLNEPLAITKDGGTLQIKTSIEPAKVVDSTLLYSAEMSDRPGDAKGIALIDETGTLKAVKNGVVKVTITPKDNAAEIEPKVIYVTISNQKNYNNQYQPRISASTITLNKQADRGYGLNIYSLGVGTSIVGVSIDPESRYAEAFTVTKNGETGTWDVCFAEGKKEEIRNGTYRVPLIIQSEVAFEGYSYNDTFTMTLRIRVVNNAPRVTAQAVTVNRYYTKSEYPITLRAAGTDVVVTGLADAEGMMFITDFFDVTTRDEKVYLMPKQQFGAEGALSDRNSIKGYLVVRSEGYLEQKVPITVYLSDTAPKVVVNEATPVLNYSAMMNNDNPAIYFTFSEKITNKEATAIDDLQMVMLDQGAPDYEELNGVFTSVQRVDMEDGSVGAMILINRMNVQTGTYRLPLLITTSTFRDVPVTAKVVVQRETDAPKLTLEKTTLKLNSSYPGEIASVKVRSISQSNVVLDDFAITAWNDGLLANKDAAVTLVYNDETQRLEATVVGKPAGDTYRFTCIPQYEAGVESEQEITVTVKLHKNTPSVEVSAKGKIDVLRRDDTAVTYSLTKINFTDDIESVKLVSPAKISGTIRDGKDAFEMSWDEDEETITLKADSDFKFIKGKKYAFRFEITKEHGLEGSDNASAKTILTKDISITPVQTKVGFIIDKTPVFYRFVSSDTNTQSINLRTDAGAISKVEVQPGYVAPAGIVEKISEDGTIVESLSFDGVNNYNLKSGSYAFRFDVYLGGQLCEEVNGQAVEKPTTCRVRFVIH